MLYKATKSFTGLVRMKMGEVRELDADSSVVKDLLRAGYIEEVKKEKKTRQKKEVSK